jgi:hypothetical protein
LAAPPITRAGPAVGTRAALHDDSAAPAGKARVASKTAASPLLQFRLASFETRLTALLRTR